MAKKNEPNVFMTDRLRKAGDHADAVMKVWWECHKILEKAEIEVAKATEKFKDANREYELAAYERNMLRVSSEGTK